MKGKENTGFETLTMPDNHAELNAMTPANHISPELVLIMDSAFIPSSFIPVGQPMMTNEGRIFLVTGGTIDYNINMMSFHASIGQVLVFPIGAIIELEERSEDFRFQGFVFRDLPMSESLRNPMLVDVAEAQRKRFDGYLCSMQMLTTQQPLNMDALRHLQQAFIADLAVTAAKQADEWQHRQGDYRERLFTRFIELLNRHGTTEHAIPFYANQLCLSPNRLSAVIKEYSGQTVMQWLNRRLVLQAKVLLRGGTDPIGDIAFALGFDEQGSFARFFKRETGMTPTVYRGG
ncbi:MAG: AraC family transcriptional regulator [Bacteroidales bacterium]|nr:AraC family transcriptional regulator [Bacteroidales bacterium]